MSPSKILIGQFLTVLAIILVAIWGATQWTAHQLDYQQRWDDLGFIGKDFLSIFHGDCSNGGMHMRPTHQMFLRALAP